MKNGGSFHCYVSSPEGICDISPSINAGILLHMPRLLPADSLEKLLDSGFTLEVDLKEQNESSL